MSFIPTGPGIAVNIVAFENGVGNSRDIRLLADGLREAGCDVTITLASVHARRRRRIGLVRAWCRARWARAQRKYAAGAPPRFDVTVMLEHVWPEQLHLARRNVIVPNPEFFDRHDRRMLPVFDAVWAKTQVTREIFAGRGLACALIGFDSEDRLDRAVVREDAFFHLAGKSRMKGTSRLLEVWARHGEWPTLTVVWSKPMREAPVAANIRYHTGYLRDEELRVLQNRHRFHVCTSETEGWGHYLVEAQSVGAIVLVTDAPPMNELVTPARGQLLRAHRIGQQHLASLWAVGAADFERAMSELMRAGPADHERLMIAARSWFEANKRGFASRLTAALAALGLA